MHRICTGSYLHLPLFINYNSWFISLKIKYLCRVLFLPRNQHKVFLYGIKKWKWKMFSCFFTFKQNGNYFTIEITAVKEIKDEKISNRNVYFYNLLLLHMLMSHAYFYFLILQLIFVLIWCSPFLDLEVAWVVAIVFWRRNNRGLPNHVMLVWMNESNKTIVFHKMDF